MQEHLSRILSWSLPIIGCILLLRGILLAPQAHPLYDDEARTGSASAAYGITLCLSGLGIGAYGEQDKQYHRYH